MNIKNGYKLQTLVHLPDTEDENQISTTFGDAELEIATHFGKHNFIHAVNPPLVLKRKYST
jgi:hypothetical protein